MDDMQYRAFSMATRSRSKGWPSLALAT